MPLALAVICYALTVFPRTYFENHAASQPADEMPAVNGLLRRGFLLGAEGLAADWYWMKALQHVGKRMENSSEQVIDLEDLRGLNINLLFPYLDAATDLDPHFLVAYSYGAVVLPAIDRNKAIEIADKGIANNPDNWRLYQHLGYTHWRAGDYDKAAEAYTRGSQIEGSAPFMKLMSALMKSDAGSRDTARNIYREMLADPADEAIASVAAKKLAELDKLDVMDAFDAALAEFQNKNGRCANNLSEVIGLLMASGFADSPALRVHRTDGFVDAEGKPYAINRESCEIVRSRR